ncbi:MAG: alpha/beta hydrolase [Actinomycetota bacterium]
MDVRKRLTGAENLQSQLDALPRTERNRLRPDEVFLLDFDVNFAGGDGRAVVALGDPNKAEHIGILVPGMGSKLSNIESPLRNAATLRATIDYRISPTTAGRSSIIAWLGYNAPDGITAGFRGKARNGATRLVGFVQHLRDSHVSATEAASAPPGITVIGHSYGSALVGIAGLMGVSANDLVLAGSGGAGGAKHADELGVGAEHVWVARTDDDWIPYVRGLALLGKDPFPLSFGARYVPLDRDQKTHDDYYRWRSKGLLNLARIVTDQYEEVK